MTEREQRLMERIAELRVELEQQKADYKKLETMYGGLKTAYWRLQQKHGYLLKRKENRDERERAALLRV